MTSAARPGDSVFLDTNVLLTASAPNRPLHRHAQTVLQYWPARGIELFVNGQVVREYLVVATRPLQVNGLGLSSANAHSNMRAILGRSHVLDETSRVVECLLAMVRKHGITGKRIHDVNIVATAVAHGMDWILTDNAAHLRGLADLQLCKLADVNTEPLMP